MCTHRVLRLWRSAGLCTAPGPFGGSAHSIRGTAVSWGRPSGSRGTACGGMQRRRHRTQAVGEGVPNSSDVNQPPAVRRALEGAGGWKTDSGEGRGSGGGGGVYGIEGTLAPR